MQYLDEQNNSDQASILLLHLLDSNYTEANLSLHQFQQARAQLTPYMRLPMEKREATGIPRSFMMRSLFIPAHAYLYALDTFHEVLKIFTAMPDTSPAFATALASFDIAFPKLRDVRNSAHHMEDRVRRLKSRGRPLNVQPAVTTSFITTGQAMVLDDISDDKYGTTIEDGTFAQIEISDKKMSELQKLYQALVDACKWAGPPISVIM